MVEGVGQRQKQLTQGAMVMDNGHWAITLTLSH